MGKQLWWVPALGFVLVITMLTSCTDEHHQESARQVLQTFCSLHRADIFSTLLTEEQRAAASTVCAAVGMRVGSDVT